MTFFYSNDIYPLMYNDSLIMLDTRLNQYLIFNQETSNIFIQALETPLHRLDDNKILKILLDNNILTKDNRGRNILTKIKSKGVFQIEWKVSYGNLDIPVKKIKLLNAYLYLVYVHFLVRKNAFKSLINVIYNAKKQDVMYRIPTIEECNELETVINRACFYYPKKVKCLEWAVVYVLIALRNNWRVNLVVGVQNYPFLAHAWAEIENHAIGNKQEILEQMGRILTIPFNATE